MFIGVDCGTQSTKVVVLDSASLKIVGEASVPHQLIQGDHGRREQNPAEWVAAFEQALAVALKQAGAAASAVKGIGISGQQHGMVALDRAGQPVHPAKLWFDTESASENAQLLEQLGGPKGSLERLGIVMQTGYTASKVAWLRRHDPQAYARIDQILLPHDYLNFYLTGEQVTEAGDASGTGYFDTRSRQWSRDVFSLIAPELDPDRVLPRVIDSRHPAGTVLPEVAERLGLRRDVIVSSGGGDNMMAAIGTGNIHPDILTISLGTSGTLFTASNEPVVNPDGLAANFCSSTGGWLPLICTMNVTSATTQIRTMLGLDLNAFNDVAGQAPLGAGGIRLLPFFNGERVPPLPNATASCEGMSSYNATPGNMARAVLEGATYGLRYGFEALISPGTPTHASIRLVGGGAKSSLWRQMVSDIMNRELVCPLSSESAALGAALQALWCKSGLGASPVSLESLCDEAVQLDETTRTQPNSKNASHYNDLYQGYLETLKGRYPDLPK